MLLGCLATLAACQDHGAEARLDDYVTRIARVTGADTSIAEPDARLPLPARRALLLPIPRRTIDVVQFFELHGCDMGALVGFRNSPLGRVQTASQRLGYETAWLAAAGRCAGDGEWLAHLDADKRRSLPALFWNATFAGDEMRVALGGAGGRPAGDLADLLRGLNDGFTRVEQGGFEVDALERLLGSLRQGSWVGPAREDWSRWRRYLAAGSTMLRRSTRHLCLNRQPNNTTRRLSSVFLKLYVAQVQPELARHMAEQQRWVLELERLSTRLEDVAPDAWVVWYRAVLDPHAADSEWQRTRQAVVDHVHAWQRVFAYCHIVPMPGLRQD